MAYAATTGSCVDSTKVTWRRRFKSANKSMISTAVRRSRLPVGSSAMRMRGLQASARAMALPAGKLARGAFHVAGQPDLAQQVRGARHALAPASASGHATFSTAVSTGMR